MKLRLEEFLANCKRSLKQRRSYSLSKEKLRAIFSETSEQHLNRYANNRRISRGDDASRFSSCNYSDDSRDSTIEVD